LAQAVLRSAATAEERLALDLEYVARKSVVFDLKILAKTGLQVISKGSF
jgi:lipopolysaccharide/colanic/teichoic acid biosynthesis glycosyltransferase